MVVSELALPSVAPTGAARLTEKVSAPSNTASFRIGTVTVCVSGAPGAKVSVPDLAR